MNNKTYGGLNEKCPGCGGKKLIIERWCEKCQPRKFKQPIDNQKPILDAKIDFTDFAKTIEKLSIKSTKQYKNFILNLETNIVDFLNSKNLKVEEVKIKTIDKKYQISIILKEE